MAKGYLYDNGYELISREDALPDASEASQGDVLSLDSEKKPVWSAPSGGGYVSTYLDYEDTPVQDYYPVKLENGGQVTYEFISANISKPILIRSTYTKEQEGQTLTIYKVGYVSELQDVEESGTIYHDVMCSGFQIVVDENGKLYAIDTDK